MNPLAPPEEAAKRVEEKDGDADTPGGLVSDPLGKPLAMPSFSGNDDVEVSSSADPPLAVDSG